MLPFFFKCFFVIFILLFTDYVDCDYHQQGSLKPKVMYLRERELKEKLNGVKWKDHTF